MANLYIQATKYTPEVNFDEQSYIMNISGKSYPENTFQYYKPIIDWVESFLANSQNKLITFNLDLEYLNSSSLKAYFDMFDILEIAYENGKSISINWLFDKDNDIAQETGEDFIADFTKLNISLIVKD